MPKPEPAPDNIPARDFPDHEVLSDKELNLDGVVPLLLLSVWQRGQSRYDFLHHIMDDILEHSWCEGYANGQGYNPHTVLRQQSACSRDSKKLLMDASTHPDLNKVTLLDLIRECCWAWTISGYALVELATGRRPTDHIDLELMMPDQLSATFLSRDATLSELKKLALRAHLEARQSADLRGDLARRVLPPYAHGERVFVCIDDKTQYKAVGRWTRARVLSDCDPRLDVPRRCC